MQTHTYRLGVIFIWLGTFLLGSASLFAQSSGTRPSGTHSSGTRPSGERLPGTSQLGAHNRLAPTQLPGTDERQLRNLSAQFKKQHDENKSLALKLARKNGWEVYKHAKSGKVIALQGVDHHGFPIYYETHSNVAAATTTRTNQLWTGGSLGLNLNGSKSSLSGKLGIWDGGGVRLTHQELAEKVTQSDKPSQANDDHATHVAGTMVAKGTNPVAKGMSFGANLKAWDFTNDASEMADAAKDLLVSNHSYGGRAGWEYDEDLSIWRWLGDTLVSANEDYKFGIYTEQAQRWDQIAYSAPYYLIVKSAGNNHGNNGPAAGAYYYLGGSPGSTTAKKSNKPRKGQDSYDQVATSGNAKNILTVGAVNPITTHNGVPTDIHIASFSSWGPTDDGRIKPDIVGDGVGVTSCVGSSDNAYSTFNGTSMATPNVSGTLFLLQEHYSNLTNTFMLASTLKGLVLHTADEAGANPGPDYIYGWGLLNAERAASVITNANGSHILSERSLAKNATYTLQVVASGQGPLSATICWTDPQGEATSLGASALNNTAPKLVNDLYLRVSDGTTTTLPWLLDPANPSAAATRGDNVRDNVERIVVANTIPGRTYTLTIGHKGFLKNDTPQPYSLIVSGVVNAVYCSSNALSNAASRINRVAFGSINETMPAGCANYRDFTHVMGDIIVGQTQAIPLAVSLGTCGADADKVVKVFVDWNSDSDFADANELVGTSDIVKGNGTYNTIVAIPADLVIGNATRLRLVLMETGDAAAVKACGTYAKGETQDYTLRFVHPANDVGVVSQSLPQPGFCADPTQRITVKVRNYGTTTQTTTSVTTVVSDAGGTVATLTGTYTGALSLFGEAQLTLNGSFNALAGRQYTFTSYTTLANDQRSSNDQAVTTRTTSSEIAAPTARAAICGAAPVALRGSGNGTLFWYDAASGGNLLAAGNNTTTPVKPKNDTYYVAINDLRAPLGLATKQGTDGTYGQFGPQPRFITQVPLVIESARLYVGKSGRITFSVITPEGKVVSSSTLDMVATRNPAVPAGTLEGQLANDASDPGAVYPLNLSIPQPGTYLISINHGDVWLFRSSSNVGGFPFVIPGVINYKNAYFPSDGSDITDKYYYFYDTQVKALGCASARVAVVASNGSALEANITPGGPLVLCRPGSSVNLDAFAGTDRSYSWTKAGTTAVLATTSALEVKEAGTYVVETTRGVCSATDTVTVYALAKPIIKQNNLELTSSSRLAHQWLLNGAVIPGATQPVYTATKPGRYSVRVSQVECGTTTFTSDEVLVTIAGMEEDENKAYLLYPNPVADRFTLSYALQSVKTSLTAVVYSAQGTALTTLLLTKQAGVFKADFNASHLAAGVYFVRLQDGKKALIRSFVKQ